MRSAARPSSSAKRADSSAERITAVMPFFGYARQDRRTRSARVAITAKVVANMLQGVGVDRLLTMDLHSDQIQGFFDIPVDNIYSSPILLGDIWKRNHPNLMVVSPDVGGVVRARAIAKRPAVLLCDEPTGELDSCTGIVVMQALERVNREMATTTGARALGSR